MIERVGDAVLKRLSPRERSEPEAIARLKSEALLLEKLGPFGATPRLLARGEDAQGPWHRLERTTGPTLLARIASGPIGPDWIERAVAAAFGALATLHEAADEVGPLAVVHADPSPANLAIDDDGKRAVLLDLDLAWWRDGPPRDGAFRGTIAYAAPEIARGERPTPETDLFSLAASFLHAITGVRPRPGDSFPALLTAAAEIPLLGSEHAHLAGRGRGHALVLACLAYEPSARPPSARAALGTLC